MNWGDEHKNEMEYENIKMYETLIKLNMKMNMNIGQYEYMKI